MNSFLNYCAKPLKCFLRRYTMNYNKRNSTNTIIRNGDSITRLETVLKKKLYKNTGNSTNKKIKLNIIKNASAREH